MRYLIAGLFFALPVWALIYTSATLGKDGLTLLFSPFGFPLNAGLLMLALAGVGVLLETEQVATLIGYPIIGETVDDDSVHPVRLAVITKPRLRVVPNLRG